MNATVEMFRSSSNTNRFSCDLPTWELLHELGRAFGWQPVGTTYVLPARSTIELPARRNYEPGDPQDRKQVTREDAMSWARALETAKVSTHAAAMIQARSVARIGHGELGRQLLPGVIDEFVEFAYGGAFDFAIYREV